MSGVDSLVCVCLFLLVGMSHMCLGRSGVQRKQSGKHQKPWLIKLSSLESVSTWTLW